MSEGTQRSGKSKGVMEAEMEIDLKLESKYFLQLPRLAKEERRSRSNHNKPQLEQKGKDEGNF